LFQRYISIKLNQTLDQGPQINLQELIPKIHNEDDIIETLATEVASALSNHRNNFGADLVGLKEMVFEYSNRISTTNFSDLLLATLSSKCPFHCAAYDQWKVIFSSKNFEQTGSAGG
jgi:hypothetical protein